MHKLLLAFTAVVLLSGCSLLSNILSFDTAPFDGSEYEKISHLRTTIALDKGKCADSTFMKTASVDINNQAFELALYSQGLPWNQDEAQMEKELHQMTSELSKRYASVNSVSAIYCADKLAILLRTSASIQTVIGGKQK